MAAPITPSTASSTMSSPSSPATPPLSYESFPFRPPRHTDDDSQIRTADTLKELANAMYEAAVWQVDLSSRPGGGRISSACFPVMWFFGDRGTEGSDPTQFAPSSGIVTQQPVSR